MSLPLVVAITGASGIAYGIEILRALRKLSVPTHLVVSEAAVQTLANGRKCAQARPFLEGRLAGQGLGGRCDSAHRRPSQAR